MEATGRRMKEIVKEVNHPMFNLQLRNDGIVVMNTEPEVMFALKEAREYLAALRTITGGKPHLILKLPGELASVDSETRSFMATGDALKYSIAEAVVVRNMAQRIVGNFYIRFDKPLVPVKLFDTEPEASEWLLSLS